MYFWKCWQCQNCLNLFTSLQTLERFHDIPRFGSSDSHHFANQTAPKTAKNLSLSWAALSFIQTVWNNTLCQHLYPLLQILATDLLALLSVVQLLAGFLIILYLPCYCSGLQMIHLRKRVIYKISLTSQIFQRLWTLAPVDFMAGCVYIHLL